VTTLILAGNVALSGIVELVSAFGSRPNRAVKHSAAEARAALKR